MGKLVWVLIIVVIIGGVLLFLSGQETTLNQITFAFEGLESLESGMYEAWAVFPDGAESLGTFSGAGPLEAESERDLTEATDFMVTIEQNGDTNPEPSDVVVLSGMRDGDKASLAFPIDLTGAKGTYILATLSDTDDENETSGIWFISLSDDGAEAMEDADAMMDEEAMEDADTDAMMDEEGDTMMEEKGPYAGLVLPVLPEGWRYEGWVVASGTPLSTGRFSGPNGADNFSGFSEDGDTPPFPGEDFLINPPEGLSFPLDLADGTMLAMISIEPNMGGADPTGEAPFYIKPLTAEIEKGVEDHVDMKMSRSQTKLPEGTVTLSSSTATTE